MKKGQFLILTGFQRLLPGLLMMVLLLALAVSGCARKDGPVAGNNSGNSAGSEPVTVKVATISGPSAVSLIKLIDEPPSFGPGIKSEYIIRDNPDQIKAMMIQNDVDFATVPTNLGAILYNNNIDYRLAGVSVWGTLYLVGKDEGTKDWNDLRGKKIYLMGKGLTPDITFRYMLRKMGLDPEQDVELDYRFPMPKDLAGAVAAGKAGLAVLSEPMVSTLLDKNRDLRVVMDLNTEWKKTVQNRIPMAQTGVFVRNGFAEKHPDLVEAFLHEYDSSIQWVNNNIPEAGGLIVSHGIMPNPDVASQVIGRSNIAFKGVTEIEEGVTAYLKVLYDFHPDNVGGRLPDENFFYRR